jgi:Anti-sigma factor NepR
MAKMERRHMAVDPNDPKAPSHPERPSLQRRVVADHLDAQLGQDLRELYQSIVEEPIPTHLLALVEALANGKKTDPRDEKEGAA